ncbi:MAG: DUF2510 domain-containing protein [Microbacteriaceae bacterium]|nr:DUF2510 domain-containing protein [Microbacteriaceae bacterium]
MSDTTASGPVPGWYGDPSTPGQARWWDGVQWTADVRPLEQPAAAPVAAAPAQPTIQEAVEAAKAKAAAQNQAQEPSAQAFAEAARLAEAYQPPGGHPEFTMPARTLSFDERPTFADHRDMRLASNGAGRAAVAFLILGLILAAIGIVCSIAGVLSFIPQLVPISLAAGAVLLALAALLGLIGVFLPNRPKGGAAIAVVLSLAAGAGAWFGFPGVFADFQRTLPGFPETTIAYLTSGSVCPPELADRITEGLGDGAVLGGVGGSDAALTAVLGEIADIPADLASVRGDALCVVRLSGEQVSEIDGSTTEIEGVGVLAVREVSAARLGAALTAAGYVDLLALADPAAAPTDAAAPAPEATPAPTEEPEATESPFEGTWAKGDLLGAGTGEPIEVVLLGSRDAVEDAASLGVQAVVLRFTITQVPAVPPAA